MDDTQVSSHYFLALSIDLLAHIFVGLGNLVGCVVQRVCVLVCRWHEKRGRKNLPQRFRASPETFAVNLPTIYTWQIYRKGFGRKKFCVNFGFFELSQWVFPFLINWGYCFGVLWKIHWLFGVIWLHFRLNNHILTLKFLVARNLCGKFPYYI